MKFIKPNQAYKEIKLGVSGKGIEKEVTALFFDTEDYLQLQVYCPGTETDPLLIMRTESVEESLLCELEEICYKAHSISLHAEGHITQAELNDIHKYLDHVRAVKRMEWLNSQMPPSGMVAQ